MTYLVNRKFKLKTPSGIETFKPGDLFSPTDETTIRALIESGYVSIAEPVNVETTTATVSNNSRVQCPPETPGPCSRTRITPTTGAVDNVCQQTGRVCHAPYVLEAKEKFSDTLLDAFLERAAIIEEATGMSRPEAERQAYKLIVEHSGKMPGI